MENLKQLTIIVSVCLFGEVISAVLPFTFPGSVISMIMIFVLLWFKFMEEKHINKVGDYLLGNMAFFFIPAATAIIKEFQVLKGSILALVAVTIICTVTTFLATYYTVCFVSKLTKGGEQ